jgi:hypothetical protein
MLTRLDRCLAVRDSCKARKEQGADNIFGRAAVFITNVGNFEDVACEGSSLSLLASSDIY